MNRLAAAAGAHEAPQLLLNAPLTLSRLGLEGAKRAELTLGGDDPLDAGSAERTDQLALQVRDAR